MVVLLLLCSAEQLVGAMAAAFCCGYRFRHYTLGRFTISERFHVTYFGTTYLPVLDIQVDVYPPTIAFSNIICFALFKNCVPFVLPSNAKLGHAAIDAADGYYVFAVRWAWGIVIIWVPSAGDVDRDPGIWLNARPLGKNRALAPVGARTEPTAGILTVITISSSGGDIVVGVAGGMPDSTSVFRPAATRVSWFCAATRTSPSVVFTAVSPASSTSVANKVPRTRALADRV